MRTFKLQVQTTVDGYMGDTDGGLDWMIWEWSDDMKAYSGALHESVDRLVLGRTLAEGFIPTWAARREDPQGESPESVEFMNTTPKVVISNTLTESPWDNAVVAGGDLAETVNRLRAEPGGDMIAYGGSTLVRGLIADGLLDELHLFVHPVAIGQGLSVFPQVRSPLRLVTARPFECGVTALHYEPRRS